MSTAELNKALAKVQGELPEIKKTEKANAGQYSYTYAGLPDILNKTLPVLSQYGLSWSACPTLNSDGTFVLAYSLRHESGEEISGEYPLPTDGTPQQMGSAQTYARRYSFCAVVGIAPDDDDDGKAAEGATYSRPKPRQQPPARTVNLKPEIDSKLDAGEKSLLREQWTTEFNYPSTAVPLDREEEARTLIDSFVGVSVFKAEQDES